MKVQVGSKVTLKPTVIHSCPEGRENNMIATVRYAGENGEVFLQEDLQGCNWWNIEDLLVALEDASESGVY